MTAASEAEYLRTTAQKPKFQNAMTMPEGDRSALTEGFRLLALNIHRMLSDNVRRSIVVLSARSHEGRSTTAAGLASALSQLSPPVVLIDADPAGSGLTGLVKESNVATGDGLAGSRPALQVVTPEFDSGTPETFLDTVQDAVQAGLDAGATVIIDAPACLTSSSAFYLASGATGVLYVTRRSATQDGGVHAEVGAQLELLGARVLGVVVNEG